MTTKIKGGYILLARNIIESEIWLKPTAYLKIWIYILSRVNWKKSKKNEIGEELFNFSQEKIPGVKLTQVYDFLRWAKTLNSRDQTTQITTQKTTRGIRLKVTKFAYYQDVRNYQFQNTFQDKFQQNPNTIPKTLNNSTINTKECINISLSAKNEKPKITKEEREILKSFSKKEGAKNINAYIRKLIDNGDYLNILEEEKKKAAKRKAKQALLAEREEEQETPEPELTEEEREAFLQKMRKKAGITGNKRRSKK